MQPDALLASFGLTVSRRSLLRLASLGRPLAVLAVLAVGAILFSAAAALLGSRQPANVLHTSAEQIGGPLGLAALRVLPVHVPAAQGAAIDEALSGLKAGAFRDTVPPRSAVVPAGIAALERVGRPRPSLPIDAALPPLRVDIMGLEHLPGRAWPGDGALLP